LKKYALSADFEKSPKIPVITGWTFPAHTVQRAIFAWIDKKHVSGSPNELRLIPRVFRINIYCPSPMAIKTILPGNPKAMQPVLLLSLQK